MWGWLPPAAYEVIAEEARARGELRYHCSRCDVDGVGKACWFCGQDDQIDKLGWRGMLNPHHCDSLLTEVTLVGGTVVTEVNRLVAAHLVDHVPADDAPLVASA